MFKAEAGHVYEWKPGEAPRLLFEGRTMERMSLVRMPWSASETLAVGSGELAFLDASGAYDWSQPKALSSGWEVRAKTLPSIGSVILYQNTRAFRLTSSRALEPIAPPPDRSPPDGSGVDVLWWRRGLVNTFGTLMLLDDQGRLADAPLVLPDEVRPPKTSPIDPGSRFGLEAASEMTVLPRFKWVFLKAYSRMANFKAGWIRITEQFEVKRIEGIDANTKVLTVFDDSELGGVLLGTTSGLLSLSPDGSATLVENSPRTAFRALARSSATGEILAGGDSGLFVYRHEHLEPASGDARKVIGAVRRITNVPFGNTTVIFASLGSFALDSRGELSTIEALGPGGSFSDLIVLPELQSAFAFGNIAPAKPVLLHELGRSDDTGACSRPL
jgi:hypothetical protein